MKGKGTGMRRMEIGERKGGGEERRGKIERKGGWGRGAIGWRGRSEE